MVEVCLHVACVLTTLISFVTSIATPGDVIKTKQAHASLVQHMDTVNHHLQKLSRSIRSAHDEFSTRRIEACQAMGMMSEPICELYEMDNDLTAGEKIDDAIHSQFAPGKRSGYQFQQAMDRRRLLFQDLLRKQDLLTKLQALVEGASSDVQNERKRSCNLNLGFHCQTEQYSAIADMYNWLQSPLSPGKRRK